MAKKPTAYYARRAKITFYANVKNEKGEQVYRKGSDNQTIYRNGKPIPEQLCLTFSTISNAPDKELCRFEVTPETPDFVVEALEKMRKDAAMGIMTEQEKDKAFDPAGEAERRAKKAEEEKALIAEQLSARDREIAELQAKLNARKG